jgi:hypothetical protein
MEGSALIVGNSVDRNQAIEPEMALYASMRDLLSDFVAILPNRD